MAAKIDIQDGRQIWPMWPFDLDKGKNIKMWLHIFILLDNTDILTYLSTKSDDLDLWLIFFKGCTLIEFWRSTWRSSDFIDQYVKLKGLPRQKYPMNLILIILIFSRSIPRSNGTPSYNSAIRKFFADYSINYLSILKKLGTHIWNSLLNNFCLCSIQMSIFYGVIQEKLIFFTIYIHISKDRN